jgi:DNA helicase-2/ATP-dependent DNA helicase PcrA
LENAFKRNAIPYRIIGGTRFFDRAEVKDMLAYLSVINNRGDDLRLRRIINNPPRGIGDKTLEMAVRQAEAENICLYSVVADAENIGALEKASKKLSAFVELIEGCACLLDRMNLAEFYDELLLRTGYLAMLQEKDDPENRVRAENVLELKSSIVSYMENTDTPSLGGFLEEIALYTDIEQYDPEADAVVMMTMHSAKGLEFPNVFLVGLETGIFPSTRSEGSSDDMEEERRLCYVAITRAKETLAISYARQRMLYGQTTYGRPSRFLMELPAETVTGKKITPPKPEEAYIPQRASMYGDYDGWSGRPAAPRKQKYTAFSAPKSTTGLSLKKGDMVQHKAFGKGMVLSVLPMGNDALLEIAFDSIGTKKLMERTAGAHMVKL